MTCTFRDKILQFDRAVPRYTSYPTAPHFKPITIEGNPYASITPMDTVSLYVHIPFCAKMCHYCGCNTKITRQYDPIESYVSLLLNEINLIAAQQNHPFKVNHIHFGGGSPGILSPYDFEIIMSAIERRFNILPDAEIAIELDPRGVTEGRVATYAKMGVNRVSLGVQDFNDDVLKSVNRQQPFHLSFEAVKLLRDYGINNFNFDLIYGLPHQTPEKMKRTVDLALSLNPNRISLFGYAHVPWMKKHMRLIDEKTLPDKAMRFDLFQTGAQLLEDNGYIPVGIDHFVKPDDAMATAVQNKTLNRNFQGYTTDQSDIMIGIGLSSIGKTQDNFYQNHPDMHAYKAAINANKLPIGKSCPIQENDKIIGAIIKDLMCYFETDLNNYDGDYTDIIHSLKPYEDAGFITIQNSKITIMKSARPIARLVCAAFDEYLPPEITNRHSKAI